MSNREINSSMMHQVFDDGCLPARPRNLLNRRLLDRDQDDSNRSLPVDIKAQVVARTKHKNELRTQVNQSEKTQVIITARTQVQPEVAGVEKTQVDKTARTQVSSVQKTQVNANRRAPSNQEILAFCQTPQRKNAIAAHFGYKNAKKFGLLHLRPLLASGQLRMTKPDKPTSCQQEYVATVGC